MKVQRQQHGKRGAFFIEENGEWVAEMTYSREGTRKIVIDHTEVDESLKGKGIGKYLVAAAVQYARKNNLLIKPTCPFVKKVLEKNAEFEDILST
ncbi:MAG: N-acetyltransferase [Acidobacteriota bacterium]|nr:N-acetyltransferase [Acidobacteriota bacterium]